MKKNDRCTIMPRGWSCSRTPGHDGPCAASPTGLMRIWCWLRGYYR